MRQSAMKYSVGPFIILTLIYFIVGFLTTVNGQFQGPLNIAFLSEADELRNTLTTMISFFFFLGYLVSSGLAGKWVDKCGYRATLVRALGIMTAGLLLYSLSSWVAETWPEGCVAVADDRVPWGYFIFLAGSFLMGTSAAMLQVVINPYVSAYSLRGTTPVQRMNIVCGVNSVGTTVAPFFVTGVVLAGVAMESVTPGMLLVPFLIIAAIIAAVTAVSSRLELPDLAHTRSEERLPRKVIEFRHLALGVLAIFFYVGTEVAIGVNVNLHAMQMIERGEPITFFGLDRIMLGNVNLGIPALLATLYWGGMMVGRLVSSCFNSLSPRILLISTTVAASLVVIVAMALDNLWILVSAGLVHSVMWGCIFTLATAGLGRYTTKASGMLMAGVFGGAVFPVLQGVMADALGSWRWTWTVALVCELYMLWYALRGCRVKDAEALANINAAPSNPV